MRSRWPCSPRSYSSWPELFGVPEVSSTLRQASFEKCVLVTLLFAAKIIPLKLIQPSQARTKDFKRAWKYVFQRNWEFCFLINKLLYIIISWNFAVSCCLQSLKALRIFSVQKIRRLGPDHCFPAWRVLRRRGWRRSCLKPLEPTGRLCFRGLGMFVDWRLGDGSCCRRCSGKLQIQKTC